MTSADVQRLERGFVSTTRANANSSVQPSGLSSSAAVRANAANTEGLAFAGWSRTPASLAPQFRGAEAAIGVRLVEGPLREARRSGGEASATCGGERAHFIMELPR
jgi:hypothetical protein